MSTKTVFVLVPSLIPTGPMRGAVALCNGLVHHMTVNLVVLKPLTREGLIIDDRVKLVYLGQMWSWWERRKLLSQAMRVAGGRDQVVSISFCLSADIFNVFMRRHAFIVSSVRGNLPRNYRSDYGPIGLLIAWVHLVSLNVFDLTTAMSKAMVIQMRRFGLQRIVLIGNFVDEATLERQRVNATPTDGPVRFLFLASLSRRKRPEVLLRVATEFCRREKDLQIDVLGDGPLRTQLERQVERSGLSRYITFHGHVSNPYRAIQKADYMVLPSESEGVSRASLEALFFGVPCILRDVDASREIITPGINGELFNTDEELVELLLKLASTPVSRSSIRGNLLPALCRQDTNIRRFMELMTL